MVAANAARKPTLRAKRPTEQQPRKPTFMISGKSGVGKTWTSMDFPKCYYIDVEGGADLPHYTAKLEAAGGVYLGPNDGANDFETVIEQVKALATTQHEYRTLIIDSFSKLYNTEAGIAEETVGNDFGRDKKEAQKPTRRLLRALEKLDMTVILICHEKDKWERKGSELTCVGQTFDGWEKLEYELHLWLQIQKRGNSRVAIVRKSRMAQFSEGETFDWAYPVFAEKYGKGIIESESKPVEMANEDDVKRLAHLVDVLKLEAEAQAWLTKAGVDSLAEMEADIIGKCLAYCEKKLGNDNANDNAKENAA